MAHVAIDPQPSGLLDICKDQDGNIIVPSRTFGGSLAKYPGLSLVRA